MTILIPTPEQIKAKINKKGQQVAEAPQFIIKNAQLLFPKLAKPESYDGMGEKSYSAILLLDPRTEEGKSQLSALKKLFDAMSQSVFQRDDQENPYPKLQAQPETLSDGQSNPSAGMYGLKVSSKEGFAPPGLFDGRRNKLSQNVAENIGNGSIAHVVIKPFTYNSGGVNRGISLRLVAVQLLKLVTGGFNPDSLPIIEDAENFDNPDVFMTQNDSVAKQIDDVVPF